VSSRPDDLCYRQPTPADAPQVAELAVEGFATYRAFAPAQWQVPSHDDALERSQVALGHPSTWGMLAEEGSRLRGHVVLFAAADSRVPSDDPALAHLWQLFVAQAWWGSGLAARLMSAAVEAAARHGFERMRLWTPGEHGRARRFYEREGWTAAGESVHDPAFGMATIEYHRDLG
jgi:GNAT superfamily N-acetyltransferase